MFSRLFVILFICYLATIDATCPKTVYKYGVSQAEATNIVAWHNYYRTLIAQGKVGGQPKASNMRKLAWDSKLAAAAQNIANTCVYGHVKVSDGRWFAVGQNLYMSSSSVYVGNSNWPSAVQAWYNEVSSYKYPAGFSMATGHYTQVVNADTVAVGCGYINFFDATSKWFKQIYVCNYGPAGNVNNNPPYKTGAGCENLC